MTNNLFNLIPDGENFIKSNCPKLYAAMKETAAPAIRLCAATPKEDADAYAGFQDVTDIQDISYDSDKKTLKAQSVAGFRERKGVIAIVSEVFDSVTGESIKGSAVMTYNAHSLVCNVDSQQGEKGLTKIPVSLSEARSTGQKPTRMEKWSCNLTKSDGIAG